MQKLSDKGGMIPMKAFLFSAVDFVLPPRCVACGDILGSENSFCVSCWAKMHLLAPPACSACGLPLPFETDEAQQCGQCMAKPPLHDGIQAVAAYCDTSRQVILKLKHGGKIGLAKLVSQQMVRLLPEDAEDYLAVPVPLHWSRLWARSFNQSALIAQSLAEKSRITFAPDLLLRRRRTELLRGKSLKERKQEVAKAFSVNSQWSEKLAGRNIILIDDVYTTGATSDACVKCLKAAGAAKVMIYCWARVLPDENIDRSAAPNQLS